MKSKERKSTNELMISGRDISAHLEAVEKQQIIVEKQKEQAKIEMELYSKRLEAAQAKLEIE